MQKILFAISQLYKGGAETSLVNLLNNIDYTKYEVDLLVLNQCQVINTVSLIEHVNSNVNICDAYKEYSKVNIFDRIRAKLIYSAEQKGAYYFPAIDFVRNKNYDCAFWIGEWVIPSFVAFQVNARKKVAWMHTDISKAKYFDEGGYFSFDSEIDKYLFVSEQSKRSSVEKYPFIQEKSEVIYNICDAKAIIQKSKEEVNDFKLEENIPVIITCANIRDEKNHLRQVRVMAELIKKGIKFYWVNIGSTANAELTNKVKSLCKEKGLEKYFLLVGAKSNPYKYMKKADAIAVLSDFESWSMVITEAKILGIPVIATKTSGAIEQIEHNKTGILTEFTEEDIISKMEYFLTNSKISQEIKKNIINFDNTDSIIKSFDDFTKGIIEETIEKKDVLYVIDDINYQGGAHSATFRQINELVEMGREVSVFSNAIPQIERRMELHGVNFFSWRKIKLDGVYHRRVLECLTDKNLSMQMKKMKLKMYFKVKFKKDANVWNDNILKALSQEFSKYNVICVMSEGSMFREVVANTKCNKKVQWIHTDYCAWKEYSDWTRELTRNDEEIYKKFDCIVVLSEKIKNDFTNMYPFLEKKVEVVKNIMPVDSIKEKSLERIQEYPPVHFISVGRLSTEKAFDRLIKVLAKLKKEGYQFKWDIVGDGPEKMILKDLITKFDLKREVVLFGEKGNPYIYMKKAQVFALLSRYEGMPNTIFESLILGVPVLATNVGGISEQIIDNSTGWLVENDEEKIYTKIKYLIENQDEIKRVKKEIENYDYGNELVISKVKTIFEDN